MFLPKGFGLKQPPTGGRYNSGRETVNLLGLQEKLHGIGREKCLAKG